ncbi:hypothetical protein ACSL103130_04155 [Actinomyces slackii]
MAGSTVVGVIPASRTALRPVRRVKAVSRVRRPSGRRVRRGAKRERSTAAAGAAPARSRLSMSLAVPAGTTVVPVPATTASVRRTRTVPGPRSSTVLTGSSPDRALLTRAGQSTGSMSTAWASSRARVSSSPQALAQAATSSTAGASSGVWKGTEVARNSVTGASTAPPRRRSLRALALRAAAASSAVITFSRSAGRPERIWAWRPLATPTEMRSAPGTRASTESRTERVTPRTESMGVNWPTVARSRRRVVRVAAAPMRRAMAWT